MTSLQRHIQPLADALRTPGPGHTEAVERGLAEIPVVVTVGQWRIANRCFLKFANGFGLMSKSTDWEPQVGILWELR